MALSKERLEHIRWLCGIAIEGDPLNEEGMELLGELDRLEGENARLRDALVARGNYSQGVKVHCKPYQGHEPLEEGTHMTTIVDEIARTLWTLHWVAEHNDRLEQDPDHLLPWSGEETIIAPAIPERVWIDAGRLVGMLEALNGDLQINAAWARALTRDGRDWQALGDFDTKESKEEFGYALAMEAVGSGVAWSDDHEDHGLVVPDFEPSYMPDVFGGPECSECHEDACLRGWDACDACHQVVCTKCQPVVELRCSRCVVGEFE